MLGVLMLDTHFPRPPGDVGHPGSWRMPVRFATVPGASARRVVLERDPALLQPFIDAGLALVAQGARALTTSCGFLFAFQASLQAALPVPLWTSSLLWLPRLDRPGVLTVDGDALLASGLCGDVPLQGLPTASEGGHLRQVLLDDLPHLDASRAEADAVHAARLLVQRRPDVRQLVLECTNLPPYAQAIERAVARPVHHLLDLVHARYAEIA